MISHATHRLRLASLPFESEDIEHIVSLIVQKSQGIFLWLECALDSVLSTVYTLDAVPEALEGIPSDMTAFLESILENMSQKLESNKRIAKVILQNIVCAMRPLTEKELKATLTPMFGQIASLEYTVKQVCPHLIRISKINQDEWHFQLIHETVREFLLGCTHSEFGIDSSKSHHQLALVCLDVWSDDAFLAPISSSSRQPRSAYDMDQVHPLLRYSAISWFDHVQQALIDKELETSIRDFLRTSVLSWVEAVGLLNDVSLLTLGALALEACVLQSPLISLMDRKLISGWAVDLVRIGPKYGRNITAYPFSIHKLLPPFCPTKTRIGSQFAGVGGITIVGTGLKNWDDCLAHMPVGRNGEICKFLMCGDSFLAIGLSGIDGMVVLYDTETCQELRKLHHGERLGAMDINTTGESLVTGGVRSLKIWDLKTGEATHELKTTGGSRCLAVSFKAGSKSVAAFTSNDTLTTWNFQRNVTQCVRWNRPTNGDRYRGSACSAVFSKDATRLNLAYKGWPLEVWDLEKMVLIGALATRSPVSSCYNSCNEDVYSVDHDGSIIHLAMENEKVTKTAVDARVVACNATGTLVATGNADGVLKLFAADNMELLYKLDKYTEPITDICFSPDGTKLFDVRSSECNVWVPEVLLVSVREDSSISGTDSENSSFGRIPQNVALESSRALVNVTALASDSTGSYICCGKSNGAIFIHDTQSGRQLQFLYNHDVTVNIEAITWSQNGFFIASGDNSGRIVVAQIQPISSTKWSCNIKLDFTLDHQLDGGVRQLLMDPACSSILVSSQGSHRMFNIESGKDIGKRQVYDGNFTPWWLNHPLQPGHIILFEPENAKIFTWEGFTKLTADTRMVLKFVYSPHPWVDRLVRMKAFATQDGQRIVTEWSTGDRGKSTNISYWNTADFDTESDAISEAGNWNNLLLNSVVGIYRSQAVFLDRDLWLCSSACSRNGDTTRHFYMPMDWLNTTESRLSLITRSGEFVYAKHGEVIIVKCGMRSNQGSI
jgi:WD40 repeat protein